MYGAITVGQPVRYGYRVAVRSVEDLAYLISEREVITGQPERDFVAVLSGTQARYHVRRRGTGFEVSRTDVRSENEVSFFLLPDELVSSPIGQAMSDGRLFCQAMEAGHADRVLV